jgi:hypothetical protein
MGFCCGDLRERDHLEDPGIDGWLLLKWVLKKWDGEGTTGWLCLGIRTGEERWRMR